VEAPGAVRFCRLRRRGHTQLIVFWNGSLYGTTKAGGTGFGTVFQLSPPAAVGGAWTKTVLYSFAGGSDGNDPTDVVFDSSGTMYGITWGSYSYPFPVGNVFQLTPPTEDGGPWTETVLYEFGQGTSDGCNLQGLAFGPDNALYGTTFAGGPNGCYDGSFSGSTGGTVFRLAPPASAGGAWTETILYTFTGGSDGNNPDSGVVFDASGKLYGTTQAGGDLTCYQESDYLGCGIVFQLTPPAIDGAAWTETVIHEFTMAVDGFAPGGLVLAGSGALDSFSRNGDIEGENYSYAYGDNGVVVEIASPAVGGGAWTANVIYNFAQSSDAAAPSTNLVADSKGALYGTSLEGGSGSCAGGLPGNGGCGTVFRLTPPAEPGGPWTETVLHSFPGFTSIGTLPSPVLVDNNGALLWHHEHRRHCPELRCSRLSVSLWCHIPVDASSVPGWRLDDEFDLQLQRRKRWRVSPTRLAAGVE